MTKSKENDYERIKRIAKEMAKDYDIKEDKKVSSAVDHFISTWGADYSPKDIQIINRIRHFFKKEKNNNE